MIPVIDIGALICGDEGRQAVAHEIGQACREHGFFLVRGHGVCEQLTARLERASRAFFAQDLERKLELSMERGGRAWRGYFPVGGELTSGAPDQKEGLYFGSELSPDHPRVLAGTPLHGPNLFPADLPGLRAAVLEYLDAMTTLGHALMEGLALSLDLDGSWFHRHLTADPTVLLRVFHYPPLEDPQGWSVGEHTDYGLLTILHQDQVGGLEVCTPEGWLAVPPTPGTFVCNLGDMLDRMTGGLYRSTPHRVRNPGAHGRLSLAFFFDPDFEAQVRAIPTDQAPSNDSRERWDSADLHAFEGTYGEYLMAKVSKVFPGLGDDVL